MNKLSDRHEWNSYLRFNDISKRWMNLHAIEQGYAQSIYWIEGYFIWDQSAQYMTMMTKSSWQIRRCTWLRSSAFFIQVQFSIEMHWIVYWDRDCIFSTYRLF